jgi:two-component system, NtrC family, response regulator PilR
MRSAHILVLDDEPDLLTLYELTLLREGHAVRTASTLAEARQCLQEAPFDLVITDMRLPDGMGLSLIQESATRSRAERFIVITAYGSAESAVVALKSGAFDYLTKPVDLKQFRVVVAAALKGTEHPTEPVDVQAEDVTTPDTLTTDTRHMAGTPPPAKAALVKHRALERLVGQSAGMVAVKERVLRVAGSMAPVMVLGESGTGKELVARAIHDASHRAGGPFVAVNCGAIPDTLIEAEFFGAKKGAYTGATSDRQGYFVAARGGTLFLDEIGDLPLPMQTKLLRVIQERRVRPLGATQEEDVDVRLLSATHKDLNKAVAQGHFRQDLYYRLNVIDLYLPPLRERRDDLSALIQALMKRICRDSGQSEVAISQPATAWLMQHSFTGNVRELENLLHRALALCDGHTISLHDLVGDHAREHIRDPHHVKLVNNPNFHIAIHTDKPAPLPSAAEPPVAVPQPKSPAAAPVQGMPSDLQQHLDALERDILIRALQESKGNRTAAAVRLGLNLRQMRYRIARLGIEVGGDHQQTDTDSTPEAASEDELPPLV